MHELSIAEAIIKKAVKLAKENESKHITEIHVEVGGLSGVNAEALELAFPIAATGTLAQDAELIINFVPAKGKCRQCGQESEFEPFSPLCPNCTSTEIDISCGRQLLLNRIELMQ